MHAQILLLIFLCSPFLWGCVRDAKQKSLKSSLSQQLYQQDSVLPVHLLQHGELHTSWIETLSLSNKSFKRKEKTYYVYPFKKILQEWKNLDSLDIQNTTLKFLCKDPYLGYSSLEQALSKETYLAFAQLRRKM